MFSTVVMLALAAVPTAGADPQTPPSANPLPSQNSAPVPHSGVLTKPAAPVQTLQPPPAEGQAASGVTSYPASFFSQYQPNTATDMINYLPGFVFDDGDSVRGFAGAAGNVLIDGERPTSKSDDLYSILRRIPATQVERIDIIRGGAPGIDMQGKTVMANVIRKKNTGVTGVVQFRNLWIPKDGRQLPGVRLEGQDRTGDTSLEGSFAAASFDDDGAGHGPEVAVAPDGSRIDKTNDKTRAGGVQIVATGAYTLPAFGGTFRTNAQLFGQTYIYDEVDQDVTSLSIQPNQEHDRQNKEQSELGLTYDRSFGPKISTETLFIQQLQGEDYLSLYSEPGEVDYYRENHTNGESILRSTVTYNYSKALTLETGGEGDFNWLFSHTNYLVNAVNQDLPAAAVHVNEARGEVFGKATWIINPQFNLEVGIRLEGSHIASTGDVVLAKTLYYPKPRAVLTWSPEANDQFRFRVEEEVSQLDFNDFVASPALTTGQVYVGNPNLVPQQALVFEAAYEHRFWKSGDFSFTYRHSSLTDVIDRAPVLSPTGDYDSPANIGGGSEDEYLATFNLPLQPFGVEGGLLKGNLTWRTSSVTDPTTGKERPISGLRPRDGNLEFDQDLPKWKFKWGAIYYIGWRQPYYRFSEVEVDELKPLGNLFAEYTVRQGLTLRGEIDNIGEQFRRTLEEYPDLRSTTAQEETDTRSLFFGPALYFRARQSF